MSRRRRPAKSSKACAPGCLVALAVPVVLVAYFWRYFAGAFRYRNINLTADDIPLVVCALLGLGVLIVGAAIIIAKRRARRFRRKH